MPLEIREMHIKAVIDESGNSESQSFDQPASEGEGTIDKQALMAEIIEAIMDLLEEKKER